MRFQFFALLCLLLMSACASTKSSPQPEPDAGRDAAPPDDRDAAALPDASDVDARVPLDAALEPDASEPEPECPRGTTRQYRSWDSLCPLDNMECFSIAEDVTCARYVYTEESCADVGGTVVGDSDDDCPDHTSILGTIEEPDGTYSLCCRDLGSCAPQIVQSAGTGPTTVAWFWDGSGCGHFFDNGCAGPDCDRIFASQEACYEAYEECNRIVRRCGLGGTCFDDEYCAYAPGAWCSEQPEGTSAACLPRPDGCDDVYDPVCACDHMTYANRCEAARLGLGVLHLGTCESFEEYCTAPCGLESDAALVAECAAFTRRNTCVEHALDPSDDASVPELTCRWTSDYYFAANCPD